MAKKLSASELKEAHATFLKAVGGTFDAMGQGGPFKRFKGEGPIAKLISRRQYERFLAEGGKAGDWKSFAEWLMKNLPAIIAMIMALFA